MSVENLYELSPRELFEQSKDVIESGLTPIIEGPPGCGKSAIGHKLGNHFNLEMIDHRLSTSAPEDLTGYPQIGSDGFARFYPFADLFPIEGTPLPKDKDGWLLFLDEFTSAKKEVFAAAYKLILDDMVGQKKLHQRVAKLCAGNRTKDKAIANNVGTAMQSRLIWFTMRVDFEQWLEDVAFANNYDPKIIAYLTQKPSELMQFDPAHNEKTFECPRTWEFMNKLTLGGKKPVHRSRMAQYAGAISAGKALEFVKFVELANEVPNIKDILSDPRNTAIPETNGLLWASISIMMEHVNKDNFADLATYANRMGLSHRVLFFRSTIKKLPEIRQHSTFGPAMREIAQYLHGTSVASTNQQAA